MGWTQEKKNDTLNDSPTQMLTHLRAVVPDPPGVCVPRTWRGAGDKGSLDRCPINTRTVKFTVSFVDTATGSSSNTLYLVSRKRS